MGHLEFDTGAKNRPACNAGCKIGAKQALKPKQVWAIRFRLDRERRLCDCAMFDLAIDSKLHGVMSSRSRSGSLPVAAGFARERSSFSRRQDGPYSSSSLSPLAAAFWPGLNVEAGRSTTSSFRAGSTTLTISARGSMPVGRGVGDRHWTASRGLRDAFATPNQGVDHLQTDGQPARCADPAWPHEDRKHRSLSRGRHRGCARSLRGYRFSD